MTLRGPSGFVRPLRADFRPWGSRMVMGAPLQSPARARDRETERQRHRETERQRNSETAAIGPRRLAGQAERQRDREAERQRRRF